jgi:hypothetical protein
VVASGFPEICSGVASKSQNRQKNGACPGDLAGRVLSHNRLLAVFNIGLAMVRPADSRPRPPVKVKTVTFPRPQFTAFWRRRFICSNGLKLWGGEIGIDEIGAVDVKRHELGGKHGLPRGVGSGDDVAMRMGGFARHRYMHSTLEFRDAENEPVWAFSRQPSRLLSLFLCPITCLLPSLGFRAVLW